MKKTIILILAIVLLLTAAVAGTVAWLQDSTNTITNTFTVGKVDINLTETKNLVDGKFEVQLIPGNEYEKDPKVTVFADSEECYLYVKREKINNPDAYLTYTDNLLGNGWTPLEGVENVYYRVVTKSASDQEWDLLGSKVTVNTTVKNTDLAGMYNSDGSVNAAKLPQLKYTAYAIQKANTGTAKDAWDTANFS